MAGRGVPSATSKRASRDMSGPRGEFTDATSAANLGRAKRRARGSRREEGGPTEESDNTNEISGEAQIFEQAKVNSNAHMDIPRKRRQGARITSGRSRESEGAYT